MNVFPDPFRGGNHDRDRVDLDDEEEGPWTSGNLVRHDHDHAVDNLDSSFWSKRDFLGLGTSSILGLANVVQR
jgi:hypothetical protein